MGKNTIAVDNFKYFYHSRSLPHLFDINKPVLITFRLKFSLPKSIESELLNRKREWNDSLKTLSSGERQSKLKSKDYQLFLWFDELIAGSVETPDLLSDNRCIEIISHALHYHDNVRYQLLAFCIMPNHVHVIINPLLQDNDIIFSISHITYTWKKYSATQINKHMQMKGSLWQSESYDHLIRDQKELFHYLEYVMENPIKAGLVSKWYEWKGTWVIEELKPDK
jgi:REP element-mobilizing transposase RayT